MTAPTVAVSIYLPTSTAVTSYGVSVTIDRGRSSPVFTDIDPGRGTVMFNNEPRTFDPLYASSPYFGQVVPGRRAVVTAGGVTIMDAFVKDWNFDYAISLRSTATASLEDGLARLGRMTFDAWTATNGELPGARLTAVMARPEVAYAGSTAFDTGAFSLQGDPVTWSSNVLNYCQLIAQTDQGYFFVDRSGVLTFKDRLSFIGVSSAATLGTGGIGISGIGTSYGTELLYNRVSITRENGTAQTVSDATSISNYGSTYSLSPGQLLMQDDTQALDLATRLVAIYKDPLYRFESVDVMVHGLSGADQTTVLGLDIGSVVTVVYTPNGVGSAITRTCIVEGISHQITPGFHQMTFTLNDSTVAQTGSFWILEDAASGTFDGSGVMASPVAF